jgi:hypothetical protein
MVLRAAGYYCAGLVGQDHRLDPVPQAQLRQDDEEGTPVYVATGLRTSWADAWPAFRHFD